MRSPRTLWIALLVLFVTHVVVGTVEDKGDARGPADVGTGRPDEEQVVGRARDGNVFGDMNLRDVIGKLPVDIDFKGIEGVEKLDGLDSDALPIAFEDGELEEELLNSPLLLQALTDRDPSSLAKPVNVSSMMLISLADGTIVALDENTGERIWTVDTGSPLVMSSKEASSL